MKKFEPNREIKQMVQIKKFKHPIPLVYFKPLKENDKTCIFLFVGGLGGTIPFLEIMNYPFFNNHYLFGFERASHGNNLNKPKRFPIFFLKELDKIIDKIHDLLPNKCIYILGES
jgi:hypothetical protein